MATLTTAASLAGNPYKFVFYFADGTSSTSYLSQPVVEAHVFDPSGTQLGAAMLTSVLATSH
jgi:hypothetical protein